jgi:hypothetical protein
MMMRVLGAILIAAAPSCAAAALTAGSPPHDGPTIARFFFSGPPVDGVPIYGEQWRCWTGSSWMPLNGLACRDVIFHGHPPDPAPAHQRRME